MATSRRGAYDDRGDEFDPPAIGDAIEMTAGDAMIEAIADAVPNGSQRHTAGRKRVYDIDAAADYLSLSEDAMRDLVAEGRLSPVRPTRKVQFDVLDLDEFIDQLKRSKAQSRA